MDLQNLGLFRMAKTKLDWLAQRQKVLAQNIANANTPDYRAKDLRELDFAKEIKNVMEPQVQVAQTDPRHLPGTLPTRGPFYEDSYGKPYEESIDGNRVVLEEQMEKVGSVKGQYTLALNLFQKNVKMLKTALGKSQG
ncbi:flagellar basal body rod protein FlgB [Caenispirillum bisanense]|uniref:flagellar basal body rod protein FlgB n=1 Tax=Caenispirillum bisanense TaxID=414052 RepID=UPI0031DF38B6